MKCLHTKGLDCPHVDSSDMTKIKSCNSCEHINIGEMIQVWIEHKGMFDMDTPFKTLAAFYKENKCKE